MSALPLKPDMCTALAHVCYGPEADMCSARLVSAKGQRRKSFQGARSAAGSKRTEARYVQAISNPVCCNHL